MDLSGLFERFQARYPFPLDDFQVEACRAIAAGQSVIVSAPTGAGKTLVAEFAIQAALETGKRIAYTTPVKAPANVRLVALSATVANVKEIADWISIVHRPIVPIYHPHRPVPLSYAVADLAGEIHEFDKVRTGRARVIGDERHGPDQRGRWYSRRVVDPVVLIEAMEGRGWLPAIYFIFSRVGCERALED